jgi:hypothetical protein
MALQGSKVNLHIVQSVSFVKRDKSSNESFEVFQGRYHPQNRGYQATAFPRAEPVAPRPMPAISISAIMSKS